MSASDPDDGVDVQIPTIKYQFRRPVRTGINLSIMIIIMNIMIISIMIIQTTYNTYKQ